MKGSHPRPADRWPFVLRHSISHVTSFMQLGMLWRVQFWFVVNDLGGGIKGEGQSSSPAQKVVDEIKAAGGQAVANYGKMDDCDWLEMLTLWWQRIFLKTCLSNFLVNAGLLLRSMAEWDLKLNFKEKGPSHLTHWGWVTHICVSKLTIIGSDNGLSPGRRQAIIWTNAGILLIGPSATNVNEILSEIPTFS